jgi:hypothetical protein
VRPLSETRQSLESTAAGATLREAAFTDHAQIADLEARHGLVPKHHDAWARLWLDNPLYRARGGAWPIGWVLEDDGRRIVGSMGNIPLAYELEGRPLLAASGHNWVAEPAYRSAALLLLDHVLEQPDVDLYVNNTVSAASAAPVEALLCTRVPVGRWDRSGVWWTDRRGYYEARLRERRLPFPRALSQAVSARERLIDRLTRKRLPAAEAEVTVCSAFDERFDEFWAELRQAYSHRLLAVRTREMLAWHYGDASGPLRPWIAAVRDGRRLAAYATFQRHDRPAWGTRVRLVDFQSLDGGTEPLVPLLAWAWRRCRDEGVHSLEVVGRWLDAGEPLEDAGAEGHELPAWKFHYRANRPPLADRLQDPKVWDPSLYDGDASL